MSKTYIAHLPERYIEKRSDGEEWLQMPVNVSGHELTIKTVIPLTPYTDIDMEQVRKEAYDKGYQDATVKISSNEQAIAEKAYQRGLVDAWETVRKIADLPTVEERENIFACAFTNDVIRLYTATEAIEKIRQYEQEKEEQIQVGDEVIGIYSSGEHTNPFVITKWISDYYFGIYSDSGEFCQGGLKLQKTGRHFPEIVEVLKKMKEETT